MQLEYFILIDRILDLNIDEKTIQVEAQVPQQNTIFEGRFPGYPILPGVLLIESMAQTSGWILIALTKFERMPFLAMVKEAKMRSFATPGELLKVEARVVHEGSGFAVTETGGQRAMEGWQRIGTYAAGLALDSAGVKGNQEILGRMDMIIAAGGGERDVPVDLAILNGYVKGNSSPVFLNERLMNDLRPTLFLAQLSNLLAGNIAIVHGVS